MKRTVFTFVFAMLAFCIAVGQEPQNGENNTVTFNLQKKDGRYYFDGDINGVPANIMITTGVRGLSIDKKFYEKHKDELKLDLKETDKKVHGVKWNYDIKLSGLGVVRIGDVVYKGPVFVIDKLGVIKLPIQHLWNKEDGSSIVRLDLQALQMSVLSHSRLAQDTIGCNSFLLRKAEHSLCPSIYTHLTIKTDYSTAQMDGDFIIDIGNAGLLYLLKGNETVAKMIEDNETEFFPPKGKRNIVAAKGLRKCTSAIAGYTFHDVSIGVTAKLKPNGVAGVIGMKFFETPVILDFSRKRFYIKPNE